jgi:hypothetical protein
MTRLRPGDKAWIALGAGIIAYNIITEEGETFSEAVDRALNSDDPRVRRLARAGIVAVAAHLANLVPPRADIIHWSFVGARWSYVWVRERSRSIVVVRRSRSHNI